MPLASCLLPGNCDDVCDSVAEGCALNLYPIPILDPDQVSLALPQRQMRSCPAVLEPRNKQTQAVQAGLPLDELSSRRTDYATGARLGPLFGRKGKVSVKGSHHSLKVRVCVCASFVCLVCLRGWEAKLSLKCLTAISCLLVCLVSARYAQHVLHGLRAKYHSWLLNEVWGGCFHRTAAHGSEVFTVFSSTLGDCLNSVSFFLCLNVPEN